MISLENNSNSNERKIRFRPDAHILFNNDNRNEETHDNSNPNEQEPKKKGEESCVLKEKRHMFQHMVFSRKKSVSILVPASGIDEELCAGA